MTEEDALEMFGFPPDSSRAAEVRTVLVDGVARERSARGGGDTLFLRALCAQLFFFGHQPDTLLVWAAKGASMDAAASIDVQLLCPTGLAATREYLQNSPRTDAVEALKLIELCVSAGDFEDFDVERFREVLHDYYTEE